MRRLTEDLFTKVPVFWRSAYLQLKNSLKYLRYCSLTQSYPTLCDSMNCTMSGFPVLHHLLEFAQTHAHLVRDAIQSSHLLSSPSPLAFNLPSIQDFSNELDVHTRWPKCWHFSFSISSSNEGIKYLKIAAWLYSIGDDQDRNYIGRNCILDILNILGIYNASFISIIKFTSGSTTKQMSHLCLYLDISIPFIYE